MQQSEWGRKSGFFIARGSLKRRSSSQEAQANYLKGKEMSTHPIIHKEIEAMQVAGIKAVVEKRADIFPLFEPLRQACGDAICGPAMAIFHFGAVKDGFLVEAAFPVSGPVESGQVYTLQLEKARAWTLIHRGPHEKIRETTPGLLSMHAPRLER